MAASADYDRTTGQVFRQWSIPVPRTVPTVWNRVSCPLRHIDPLPDLHHHRPAPLVDSCLRIAANHIGELDSEHLESLPSSLVGRIWEYVKRTGTLSVEAWKLLATRITRDKDAARFICPLLMRHIVFVHKTQPLTAYIQPLISDSFEFLAHLTITGPVKCEIPELLQLVQLRNLAVLEIIQPESDGCQWRLTDSVVREWSKSPNPFPLLRVLRVWGNDHTTVHSLRYISAFPSLFLYDVAGRKRDWIGTGEESIWEPKKMTWASKFDMNWASDLFKEWLSHLDLTLLTQFKLLDGYISGDRRGLRSRHAMHNTTNLLRAMRGHHIKPTPFQRGDQEAYNSKSCAADKPPEELPDDLLSHARYRTFPYLSPSGCLDSGNLWGFLVYCRIGELLSDQDLVSQGLDIGECAFAFRPLVLPPRPMLNLILGDTPYTSGESSVGYLGFGSARHRGRVSPQPKKRFETQFTFIRRDRPETSGSAAVKSETIKRPRPASTGSHRSLKKQCDVSSILESFDRS